jgi:hypothetical protein
MRVLCAAVTFVALLAAVANAQVERRVFFLDNNPDGYGVDRCLAEGEKCGAAVATAYCRARQFNHAVSFHRVERTEITGLTAASSGGATCLDAKCDDYVAIVCSR